MGNSTSTKKQEIILTNFQSLFKRVKGTQSLDLQKFKNFLNQPINEEDFYEAISIDTLRKTIQSNQDQIQQFLQIQIEALQDFANSTSPLNKTEQQVLKNILLTLTRIITILHEKQFRQFSQKVFWGFDSQTQQIEEVNINSGKANKRLLIIHEDKDELSMQQSQKRTPQPPLALRLMSSLQKLCFQAGFTVKDSEKCLWKDFMISNLTGKQVNDDSRYYRPRILILRLILACVGKSLYQQNSPQAPLNPWLTMLVCDRNPHLKPFSLSLLSQALLYREWGFLPFQTKIMQQHDKQQLSLLCAQIFNLMINYDLNNQTQVMRDLRERVEIQQIFDHMILNVQGQQQQQQDEEEHQNGQMTNESQVIERSVQEGLFVNGVQEQFVQLKETQQLIIILSNLVYLLEEELNKLSSLIPEKRNPCLNVEELLGIWLRLLLLNPTRTLDAVKHGGLFGSTLKVLVFNLGLAYQSPRPNSPFLIVLETLLLLSQSTEICLLMNQRIDFFLNLTDLPITEGSYADVLIGYVSGMIIRSYRENQNCYAFNLMGLLLNISPHVQALSEQSHTQLRALFDLFTDQVFLLQSHLNPLCLLKLLQIFENLVSFGLEKNLSLIEYLWRRRKAIRDLSRYRFDEKICVRLLNEVIRRQHVWSVLQERRIYEEFLKMEHQYSSESLQVFRVKLIETWRQFSWEDALKTLDRENIHRCLVRIQDTIEAQKANPETIGAKFVQMCFSEIERVEGKKVPGGEGVDEGQSGASEESKEASRSGQNVHGKFQLLIKKSVIRELIRDPQIIHQILQSSAWSQVFFKASNYPYFDHDECVYIHQEGGVVVRPSNGESSQGTNTQSNINRANLRPLVFSQTSSHEIAENIMSKKQLPDQEEVQEEQNSDILEVFQ